MDSLYLATGGLEGVVMEEHNIIVNAERFSSVQMFQIVITH